MRRALQAAQQAAASKQGSLALLRAAVPAAGAATVGSNTFGSNRWGGGWGATWNNNNGWGWGWGSGGYSPALYYGTWGGDMGEWIVGREHACSACTFHQRD